MYQFAARALIQRAMCVLPVLLAFLQGLARSRGHPRVTVHLGISRRPCIATSSQKSGSQRAPM